MSNHERIGSNPQEDAFFADTPKEGWGWDAKTGAKATTFDAKAQVEENKRQARDRADEQANVRDIDELARKADLLETLDKSEREVLADKILEAKKNLEASKAAFILAHPGGDYKTDPNYKATEAEFDDLVRTFDMVFPKPSLSESSSDQPSPDEPPMASA